MSTPLLEVNNLRAFLGSSRGIVRGVDDVSFDVGQGKAMGLVGESGSGKSVMARAIMGLVPRRSALTGSVVFKGEELIGKSRKEMRGLWGNQIAMVFQDPARSLNPVVRVERQITEGMRRHLGVGKSEARTRAIGLLDEVSVPDPERRLSNYPHEMSGGMRQRVMIAIALACEPDLLIADEPTTALDVTVQRQILDLLRKVQRERGMSMILISHDLAVVAGRTDSTSVMYAGKLAETGETRSLFDRPRHQYTHALLKATPTIDHRRHAPFQLIPGSLPDPTKAQAGCRFAPRCEFATALCHSQVPPMQAVSDQHAAACFHPNVPGLAPVQESPLTLTPGGDSNGR